MCVLWGLQHVALLDTCSIGPSGMTINCSAARCASQGSKNKNALTATALRATTWESLPGAQSTNKQHVFSKYFGEARQAQQHNTHANCKSATRHELQFIIGRMLRMKCHAATAMVSYYFLEACLRMAFAQQGS